MNEVNTSQLDEAIATVADQVGFPGDAQSSAKGFTVQDIVATQGTGLDINIPEGDTIVPAPDGGKGWLIVFAAALILSFSSVQTNLQSATLAFFGQNSNPQDLDPCSLTPEQKLDHLIETMLKTNNVSLAADIRLLLQELNRTHEMGALVQRTQLEVISEENNVVLAAYEPAVIAVVDSVKNVQNTLYSLFGVLSSILILLAGYRWVSLLGGIVLGAGCLVTAFCDNSNIHLVCFLYGALPGIGQNMIAVSCTVAILEYFKKRRLVALLLPALLTVVASLLIQVLLLFVFKPLGINSWKSYLFLQTGVVGAVVPLSLILRPLNLKMKEGNGSLVSKIFGIEGLGIFRRPFLYTFALVWFFWEGGYAIVLSKLPGLQVLNLIPFISFGRILMMVLGLASLLGFCIPCCMPKTTTLKTTIIILSVQFVAVATSNFVASQLHNYIYAIVYSVIIGIFKGMSSPVLENAIPLVVEEKNLVIGAGVMLMGQGLGGLTMTMVADEIEAKTDNVEGCFYLAGGLFLTGFGFSVLSYHLFRSVKTGQSHQIDETGPYQFTYCTELDTSVIF